MTILHPMIESQARIQAHELGISSGERTKDGQFYTPDWLCDLMISLAASVQKPQRVLEPACGAGAFLLRLSARFANQKKTDADPLPTLFAVEQDSAALQVAQKALQDCFPRQLAQFRHGNFLAQHLKHCFPDENPCFDWVIGNPPYVRQERINRKQKKDKINRFNLFKSCFSDNWDPFFEQADLFSNQADLYCDFFIYAHQYLKPGGVLVFVVSNSWLDTRFGRALQQFLSHHFHWLYLIESACERWFADAAINPAIIVLQKKAPQINLTPLPVQLIRFHQPLRDWLPKPESPGYWACLDQQIARFSQDPAVDYKKFTAEEACAFSETGQWSLALRGPERLLHLLSQTRLWLRLDQLGRVRYPLKTGINSFFYLSKNKAHQLNIESEFLFPVIRSGKKIQTLKIHEADCEEVLFSCADSLETLIQQGKTGAVAYIRWGMEQQAVPRQKRAKPTPWPEVPSVRGRSPWYAIRPLEPPHLLCNRFTHERFFFAQCSGSLMEDQTFYGLTLDHPETEPPELIAGLLNCTLSCLLLEYKGRASLGEGVIQYARYDMAAFPILNPALYNAAERHSIQVAFEALAQEPLLPWEQSCDSPARIALDLAVLTPLLPHFPGEKDALSLRNAFSRALLKRVQERRQMARSVKKRRHRVAY